MQSSKPKEYDVKLIFLHNAELMQGLLRVTGIQQIPLNPDDVYDNPVFTRCVKESGVTNGLQSQVPQAYTNAQQAQVPHAYTSSATHFSPIVLSTALDPEALKSDKDKKAVRSLKELKRNLLARGPVNLAKDLEKDAVDNRTPTPRYGGHVISSQGHVTPILSGQALAPPSVFPGQASPYHNLPIYTAANGQYGVLQGQISPPVTTPTMTSTPTMSNTSLFHSSMPDLSNLTYQNFSMLQQSQMLQQGQIPGQVQPGQLQPGPMQQFGMVGNMMPMQMQLQQDPRTGLFQFVPVQMPPVQLQRMMPNQQQQDQVYANQPAPSDKLPSGNGYVTYDDLLKALQLKERLDSEEQAEKSRFVKKQSRSNERKLKGRSQSVIDKDSVEEALKISSRTEKPRARARDKRSRTLSSLEIQTELEKVFLDNKSNDSGNVKKATSMEMLNRKKSQGQPHSQTQEPKPRLTRAKSGSAIDYRPMEFRIIRDIPIDEPEEKSKSQLSLDEVKRRTRHHDEVSQGSPPASPSSPSLSKDSGVSDLKGKTGDASLMERLLNADTIRHQQRLGRLVRLLREEFAFDGYMENGIEDLSMGKS